MVKGLAGYQCQSSFFVSCVLLIDFIVHESLIVVLVAVGVLLYFLGGTLSALLLFGTDVFFRN